jgi:hypothetical protein
MAPVMSLAFERGQLNKRDSEVRRSKNRALVKGRPTLSVLGSFNGNRLSSVNEKTMMPRKPRITQTSIPGYNVIWKFSHNLKETSKMNLDSVKSHLASRSGCIKLEKKLQTGMKRLRFGSELYWTTCASEGKLYYLTTTTESCSFRCHSSFMSPKEDDADQRRNRQT